MKRKRQVEKLSVSAMGNVLAGTIETNKSNSAARHGNNFVRLAENDLEKKKFLSQENRRSNAIKTLKRLKKDKPIVNLS